MGKLNIALLKGIDETNNQIDKEKQEALQEAFMNEKDDSIEGFKHMDGEEMQKDFLNDKENPAETVQKPEAHKKSKSSKKNASEKEKIEIQTNTKPKKAVMGFRAEQEKMEVWKLYADATGQEIGVLCTAAIDEYIKRHKLNEDQQKFFDLKKKMLEAEKKIKSKL